MEESKSLNLAKTFLGKEVEVIIDRPLGSKHPKHGFEYKVNYGYVEGVMSSDGEEMDVYFLGTNEPLQKATGFCIAILHRKDDDDDKLIIAPKGFVASDYEIMKTVHFQEQWFDVEIIR